MSSVHVDATNKQDATLWGKPARLGVGEGDFASNRICNMRYSYLTG